MFASLVEEKKMTGPFGEPDEVYLLKGSMLILATAMQMVLSTSTPLARFEEKMHSLFRVPGGGFDVSAYYLAKVSWTLAMLWLAASWWLGSRSDGYGFNLRFTFYAVLTAAIVFNIFWARLFFVEYGDMKTRYKLSLLFLFLGWSSAIAGFSVLLVNIVRNWLVLTARSSAILASILLFLHIISILGVFVYFYSITGVLESFNPFASRSGKSRTQ